MCQGAANNSKWNNGEEEGHDACEHSGWAGEAWSALFFLKAGMMASSLAVWQDCHTTLHDSLPRDGGLFSPPFFFSCWPPWTGTTALLFPGECTELDGKERIGMPLFSPVPSSAVCICQGTSVRRKGLERPGSSFVLHVYAERGTKMKFQAKVGVLQQEDLASWFVRVSAWL